MGSKQNLHWIEMCRSELEVLEIAIRREKLNAYKVERKKENAFLFSMTWLSTQKIANNPLLKSQ